MVNILQNIGVKSVKALILKKLLLTIFRREVTHHYMGGPMVRYKVKLFNVGLFTYKKSDSSQLKHYCFDLIMP